MKFNRNQTLEWRIARVFVKWWVMRLIRKHIEFRDRTENNRSNMNIAKMKLNIARIAYWRESFQPWGDWCYFGCREFCFVGDYRSVIDDELREMGFGQRLNWDEI